MPQFTATINHIKEGVKGFTIAAAVKNIEGWETTLADMETPGTKTILRDLGKLREALQADSVDGDEVKGLVAKLGSASIAYAKHAEGAKADQLTAIGEALTSAAGRA